MLVLDLLALFHVVNQAMINILGNWGSLHFLVSTNEAAGHFFEMSRSDAERALGIYLDFTKQTESVVSYLSTARQFQHQTRVDVPKLKHAPTNLGKQLEDYLADPDFEINRRQYLAEQEAKKSGKSTTNGVSKPSVSSSKIESESRAAAGRTFPETSSRAPSSKPASQAKGPDPDLIDFFDSIEQNQQPMAIQSVPQNQQVNMQNYGSVPPFQMPQQQPFQQNGFGASPTTYQGNPSFMQQQQVQTQGIQSQQGPLQPNFTGAGFGGYNPQPSFSPTSLSPIPQDNVASFQSNVQPFGNMNTGHPQSNPFRASMMAASQTGMSGPTFPVSPPTTSPIAPQSTNPFKAMSAQNQQAFSPPPEPQFQPVQQGSFGGSPLQPTPTGTNPFARNLSPPTTQSPPAGGSLMPQQTGSTNPFRQSQFVNTATGTGWQHNQVPIGGGLDHLETVPVFPRPAQQQPWQQ
jgi:phosphatidylinositol-binding clathrin assembly protein